MASYEKKDLNTPDETLNIELAKADTVNIRGGTVARFTFEPGWRWSIHEKPVVGTELCEEAHFLYLVSGRVHVLMSDGAELEIQPGEVAYLAPGHDGWVIGDEPVVMIDFNGAIPNPK